MAAKRKKVASNDEEPNSLESQIVRIAMSGKLAKATRRLAAATVAKGLPVTFKRGDKVIKRYPDRHEEVLAVVPCTQFKLPKGVAIIGKK